MPSTQHNILEKRLRQIVRQEISRSRALNETKLYKAIDKKSPFTRRNVVAMLESGFFTLEEEAAVKALMKMDKFRYLNESSVLRINKKVVDLSGPNNDELFVEAFGDFFKKVKDKVVGAASSLKDNAAGLYDKAKSAVKAGWDKLKTLWKNFSDLVKQVCKYVVAGLKKMWDWSQKQGERAAQSFKASSKKKGLEAIKKDVTGFKKEATHASGCHDFVHGALYEKWVAGSEWVEKVVAGEGNPEEVKTVKQESSRDFDFDFSNAFVLNEVYTNFNKKILRESEGEGHGKGHGEHLLELESAVKSPVGKKIIEYAMKLIQIAFTPVAFAVKTLGKLGGNKLLNVIAEKIAAMGGPAAITYSLMGALAGEVLATILELIAQAHLNHLISSAFHAALAAFLPVLAGIVHAVQMILLINAVIVCIVNVVDIAQGDVLRGKVHARDKEGEKEHAAASKKTAPATV